MAREDGFCLIGSYISKCVSSELWLSRLISGLQEYSF